MQSSVAQEVAILAMRSGPDVALSFEKENRGGFLYITCLEGIPHQLCEVGNPPEEMVEEYIARSREAIEPLLHNENNYILDKGYNEGAVLVTRNDGGIISFYGFSEKVNLAFSLALARATGLVSKQEFCIITGEARIESLADTISNIVEGYV